MWLVFYLMLSAREYKNKITKEDELLVYTRTHCGLIIKYDTGFYVNYLEFKMWVDLKSAAF